MPTLYHVTQMRLHRIFKHECVITNKRSACFIATATYVTLYCELLVRSVTQSHHHRGCQFHVSVFTFISHFRTVSMDVQYMLLTLPSSCYHRYIFNKLHGYILSVQFALHYVLKLFSAFFSKPHVLFPFWSLPLLIKFQN